MLALQGWYLRSIYPAPQDYSVLLRTLTFNMVGTTVKNRQLYHVNNDVHSVSKPRQLWDAPRMTARLRHPLSRMISWDEAVSVAKLRLPPVPIPTPFSDLLLRFHCPVTRPNWGDWRNIRTCISHWPWAITSQPQHSILSVPPSDPWINSITPKILRLNEPRIRRGNALLLFAAPWEGNGCIGTFQASQSWLSSDEGDLNICC